jgi:type II secretory pathway pseudopilin PulG
MIRRKENRTDSEPRAQERRAFDRRVREGGFSYVEVLVTVALIALVMVPAIEGLSTGILGAGVHQRMAVADIHLTSLLEETLAQPFSALDAEAVAVNDPKVETAYSDPPGSARRRLVYLARYDGDDADGDGKRFTGGDPGLLWVRVELENTARALETLTAN